jgi:transposase-like protein
MPYVSEIRRFAAEIGRHAKERSVYLKHELGEITARKTEIEAHLHSTTVLQERLARFQPEIGGCLQCPRCWVDREMRSSLTRAPSTEKEDSFKCHTCGFELSIGNEVAVCSQPHG